MRLPENHSAYLKRVWKSDLGKFAFHKLFSKKIYKKAILSFLKLKK